LHKKKLAQKFATGKLPVAKFLHNFCASFSCASLVILILFYCKWANRLNTADTTVDFVQRKQSATSAWWTMITRVARSLIIQVAHLWQRHRATPAPVRGRVTLRLNF